MKLILNDVEYDLFLGVMKGKAGKKKSGLGWFGITAGSGMPHIIEGEFKRLCLEIKKSKIPSVGMKQ